MESTGPKPRRPRWKRNLFRCAGILLGLLPLVCLELFLRVLGVGKPTEYDDPFVGFSDVHPLFVLNEEADRYEIAKSRLKFFGPDSFPATRAPGTYRIFVLGGSTVQGRPYSTETSFPTWMKLSLEIADPSRRWEVINCGGISYASYRLTLILKEVLNYEPDLIILCTGHNEFLEEREYGDVKNAPVVLSWSQRRLSRLRTYNLLRSVLLDTEPTVDERPLFSGDLPDRLADEVGIEKYRRDDEWRRAVTLHFETSVRGMISLAQDADVPVLLIAPVSNLVWKPFKSQHGEDVTPEQRRRFEALMEQGRRALARADARDPSTFDPALVAFHQALEIDDRHAEAHYWYGMTLYHLSAYREAEQALARALEEDVCPLRIPAQMREKMRIIAEETGTPYVDAHAFFAELSRGGIPGDKHGWLVDHVHPGVEGHQRWADHLVKLLAERDVVELPADLRERSQRAYDQWRAGLPKDYFDHGSKEIIKVQNWAGQPASTIRSKP